ncbi:MAG: ABC transporter ATP-binding protein [Anaerolineaceae bacterium]|nr:ABC transporter ATP-binding protein [Anaerolineaceae bacterium]
MQPLLEIQDVTITYEERQAVQGASLVVKAGHITALIGPNGAGKTSLMRAASGVKQVDSGTIRLAGRDINGMDAPERARMLAIVPQARQLPGAFTARELVSAGRTPWMNWLGQASSWDKLVVETAMQRTDTLDLADRRVGELSGGEQQRLLLARALAQDAPLLLLDEPAAHLDLRYQVELLDRIRTLAGDLGLGVLVALHDLNLVARFADEVVLLVDGKVSASGSVAAVFDPLLLSQAYGIPLIRIEGRGRQTAIILPA